MTPDISVVVPLKDERPNVLPLVQRIFEVLDAASLESELILVDDGSTDGTWTRILEAQSSHSRIRSLRHERNVGQSAALWTGFKACRAKWIATLDGDLQNDPLDLPRMISELRHCDMVCGVRVSRKDNLTRRISSHVARRARKLLLGVDFRDAGCNLRVFRASILASIVPFNGLHRFLPILAQAAGATIVELPVHHHPRTAGNSKYGVWNRLGRGVADLCGVRWLLKRRLSMSSATEDLSKEPAGIIHNTGTTTASSSPVLITQP